ncbi:MAG: hypothetical protein M1820_009150 [Bogoriella megaspora]|nr:MAG: hypothetical protein M1820_009150 [Bogoriella megaspora]
MNMQGTGTPINGNGPGGRVADDLNIEIQSNTGLGMSQYCDSRRKFIMTMELESNEPFETDSDDVEGHIKILLKKVFRRKNSVSLMTLPAEIRNIIYDMVIGRDDVWVHLFKGEKKPRETQSSISFVNKQIRHEIIPIIYANRHFHFVNDLVAEQYLNMIGIGVKYLRDISVPFDVNTPSKDFFKRLRACTRLKVLSIRLSNRHGTGSVSLGELAGYFLHFAKPWFMHFGRSGIETNKELFPGLDILRIVFHSVSLHNRGLLWNCDEAALVADFKEILRACLLSEK